MASTKNHALMLKKKKREKKRDWFIPNLNVFTWQSNYKWVPIQSSLIISNGPTEAFDHALEWTHKLLVISTELIIYCHLHYKSWLIPEVTTYSYLLFRSSFVERNRTKQALAAKLFCDQMQQAFYLPWKINRNPGGKHSPGISTSMSDKIFRMKIGIQHRESVMTMEKKRLAMVSSFLMWLLYLVVWVPVLWML